MHSFPNHGLSEDKINIIRYLMGRSSEDRRGLFRRDSQFMQHIVNCCAELQDEDLARGEDLGTKLSRNWFIGLHLLPGKPLSQPLKWLKR